MVGDVVDVAVTRPRIRVQGAAKSFSGRVVVDRPIAGEAEEVSRLYISLLSSGAGP